MTRDDFFKNVLSNSEYASISNAFDAFEERANDLIVEVREKIEGVMSTLYEKRSSTEFVGNNVTLINRIGEIGVIENDEEVSLDDITDLDKLMSILSEFI
jgi:hypothetical protein